MDKKSLVQSSQNSLIGSCSVSDALSPLMIAREWLMIILFHTGGMIHDRLGQKKRSFFYSTFFAGNDQRKWSTNLTHENELWVWPARITHEKYLREWPTRPKRPTRLSKHNKFQRRVSDLVKQLWQRFYGKYLTSKFR